MRSDQFVQEKKSIFKYKITIFRQNGHTQSTLCSTTPVKHKRRYFLTCKSTGSKVVLEPIDLHCMVKMLQIFSFVFQGRK